MAQELEQQFEELVPFAADRAHQFLGVVKQRTSDEGLPLSLQAKSERKTDRTVLMGTLQAGNWMAKGRELTLTVFADPIGSSLQVGWQLSSPGTPMFVMGRDAYATGMAVQSMVDSKPENVRKISAILNAFHQAVFLPTLMQLADAVERARQQQSRDGFLGA